MCQKHRGSHVILCVKGYHLIDNVCVPWIEACHTMTQEANNKLKLRLLGGFALLRGEEPIALSAVKDRLLLTRLVLLQGVSVSRNRLASLLWPPDLFDAHLAAYNLRRSLTTLRRALGPDASRLTSNPPGSLLFDCSGLDVDVFDFRTALREGTPVALTRALELYQGPLWPEVTAPWLVQERSILHSQALTALSSLADAAGRHHDYEAQSRWLERLLTLAPDDLQAQQALEQAQCRRRTFWAPPGGDLILPAEHDSASETMAAWPLPAPMETLIGREREMERLMHRLRCARLLTITGMGGIGKTRLALEVSNTARTLFRGRVAWVSLAEVTEPALLFDAIRGALRLAGAVENPLHQITALLRQSPTLLTLDNLEHLGEAGAAAIAVLLRECETLHLLVTSRVRLNLAGEEMHLLHPLPTPPDWRNPRPQK